MVGTLVGKWVQDEMGPVLTYGREYEFRPDGSYQFRFTSRPRGSMNKTLLTRQQGTFNVDEDLLVLRSSDGAITEMPWTIEADRYIGTIQLVMLRPDGHRDVYFQG